MNKPSYERPTLVRHQMGMMNKFGRALAIRPLTAIDNVDVSELVGIYGSPLFVFSEAGLIERYRELHDLMTLRYPKVRLAWSYKTNYLDAICKVFHRQGAFAEVVSVFEYDKAMHIGVPPQQVHFNGPLKLEGVLERALTDGATIHIDHFEEMALAERVAKKHDLRPKVALRLNMVVESIQSWNRFGFNLENGQAQEAVKRLMRGGILELAGLHCHLGTFILEADVYAQATRKMAKFANDLLSRDGVVLEFIDMGGGFPSQNTLKAQFLSGDQAVPNLSRYVAAIAEGLSVLDYPSDTLPTLVLEPGRALVDEAGFLITTVIANKRLPDNRRGLVVDAGINSLFTSFWYNHEVIPAQPFRGIPEPTVIYGPLCMNIDVMRDTLTFPSLSVGDRVVFKNVGAYNVTHWMQFITYRPAVVLIGRDGRHALIRRREELRDVLDPEEIPEWL